MHIKHIKYTKIPFKFIVILVIFIFSDSTERSRKNSIDLEKSGEIQ